MKRRAKVRNLALSAILLFALMLGYALYKLMGLQSEMSTDVGENMVWAISQSVYQGMQLKQAASTYPPTVGSSFEHDLHLDLLKSSLLMLSQGPQLRYMQRSDVAEEIRLVNVSLEQVPIDYAGVIKGLRFIGNAVMLAEREDAGLRRDAHRTLILQVIMTVLGMLIAGGLLGWQLLMSLRMANQAKDELQVQHIQTQRLLEVLQQERSVRMRYRDFVSLMSHQLRTPLAVIDSTAQRLKRQLSEPTQDISLLERSQRIRNSVNHLNHLIGRVLDGLRLDEGVNGGQAQMSLELQRCDWVELVESALERFGDLLSGREIRQSPAVGSAPVWVDCDRTWCIEILSNLISNAHKYSPAGQPIDITMSSQEGVFTCSVRDYGPGVPMTDMALIFERFYRAQSNLSVAGIGLGLPIARTLAEWHGGSLQVDNATGGGACFSLTLPLQASVTVNTYTQVDSVTG